MKPGDDNGTLQNIYKLLTKIDNKKHEPLNTESLNKLQKSINDLPSILRNITSNLASYNNVNKGNRPLDECEELLEEMKSNIYNNRPLTTKLKFVPLNQLRY